MVSLVQIFAKGHVNTTVYDCERNAQHLEVVEKERSARPIVLLCMIGCADWECRQGGEYTIMPFSLDKNPKEILI